MHARSWCCQRIKATPTRAATHNKNIMLGALLRVLKTLKTAGWSLVMAHWAQVIMTPTGPMSKLPQTQTHHLQSYSLGQMHRQAQQERRRQGQLATWVLMEATSLCLCSQEPTLCGWRTLVRPAHAHNQHVQTQDCLWVLCTCHACSSSLAAQ